MKLKQKCFLCHVLLQQWHFAICYTIIFLNNNFYIYIYILFPYFLLTTILFVPLEYLLLFKLYKLPRFVLYFVRDFRFSRRRV
jgi:hypothetical protein